jgi:hypothetical protein
MARAASTQEPHYAMRASPAGRRHLAPRINGRAWHYEAQVPPAGNVRPAAPAYDTCLSRTLHDPDAWA